MSDLDKMKASFEKAGWKDGMPKPATATEGFVVRVMLRNPGAAIPVLEAFVSGLCFVQDMGLSEVFKTAEEAESIRLQVLARSEYSERAKAGTAFATAQGTTVVAFVPAPLFGARNSSSYQSQ